MTLEQPINTDIFNIENNHHLLLDRIWYWEDSQPDRQAFTLLNSHGDRELTATYSDLCRRADFIAGELLNLGLQGKNVILMYPFGIEFIAAFLACLFSKTIPVPIYTFKNNRSNTKSVKMIENTNTAAILTDHKTLTSVYGQKNQYAGFNKIPWYATDEINYNTNNTVFKRYKPDADDLAFLQFTSGSTSTPKGVTVTHGNISQNVQIMATCMKMTNKSVFVNWLPHFHDLGLVGCILHGLYCGVHNILLSPKNVIAKPYLWLQAIDHYRGSLTAAPNFAYQRCIDTISPKDRDKLDLSSLIVAANAAEPVIHRTIKDFTEYFQPSGFQAEAFFPCYGMSEATVFVTGGAIERSPNTIYIDQHEYHTNNKILINTTDENAQALVAIGYTWLDQKVIIADPVNMCQANEDEVGEIWLSGSSVTRGYYENPQANAKSFASLPENNIQYFRTGDLGFFHNNELFISGRLKDIIIIDGANYYPQDIETLINRSHSDINSDGVVAFGTSSLEKEKLVVAVELTRQAYKNSRNDDQHLKSIAFAAREVISRNLEIHLSTVVFLRPKQIPKTSSGKVRRKDIQKSYIKGKLDVVYIWPKSNDKTIRSSAVHKIEKTLSTINERGPNHLKVFSYLVEILKDELQISMTDIDIEFSIFFYGIDSIKLVDIHGKLEQRLGYTIPTEALFRADTLLSLIDNVVDRENTNAAEQNERLLRDDIKHWSDELFNIYSNVRGTAPNKDDRTVNNVLLTGATGYLGVFILKELLETTKYHIYCIARAMDEDAGWSRIVKNAALYDIKFPNTPLDRVKVIIGDVSKEQLGLSSSLYSELTTLMEKVYHCAAIDNFYLPYDVVKETNVIGTVNISKFCMEDSIKPLHYISSCAAALISKENSTHETIGLVNGYAQSKFVAEQIMLNLAAKGFPVVSYRLGYLYNLEADMADEEQSFETFLASILHLRCYPDVDICFDITPVEYAAKCIMKVSFISAGDRLPEYTFYNPVPLKWDDVIKHMKNLCPEIKAVTLSDFRKRFQEYILQSDLKNVKLLKSVVSNDLEEQVNQMFRNIECSDVGLLPHWCPPCNTDFAAHYIDLALGIDDIPTEEIINNEAPLEMLRPELV